MLHDIKTAFPNVRVEGVDISQYAISNCIKTMRDNLRVADAVSLPFEDNAFDVVVSINTIHNLDDEKCRIAIREIERVSRKYSFITVDAYRSEAEKERMMAWNLTAKTIKSVQDWKRPLKRVILAILLVHSLRILLCHPYQMPHILTSFITLEWTRGRTYSCSIFRPKNALSNILYWSGTASRNREPMPQRRRLRGKFA